jgi:hypothetical protein
MLKTKTFAIKNFMKSNQYPQISFNLIKKCHKMKDIKILKSSKKELKKYCRDKRNNIEIRFL